MKFTKLLIAVDASDIALHAARIGVELARSLKAELALVHVVDPTLVAGAETGLPTDELVSMLEDEAPSMLAKVRTQAGIESTPVEFIRRGKPATEIAALANEWHADMIVMGTHGRGLAARALMGSVTQGVLRHASCPVLVVRPH